MRPGWRESKHGKDWMSSITHFASPLLGKLPVSEVTSADVVEALRKVWRKRPATARRGPPAHRHGHGVGRADGRPQRQPV